MGVLKEDCIVKFILSSYLIGTLSIYRLNFPANSFLLLHVRFISFTLHIVM